MKENSAGSALKCSLCSGRLMETRSVFPVGSIKGTRHHHLCRALPFGLTKVNGDSSILSIDEHARNGDDWAANGVIATFGTAPAQAEVDPTVAPWNSIDIKI